MKTEGAYPTPSGPGLFLDDDNECVPVGTVCVEPDTLTTLPSDVTTAMDVTPSLKDDDVVVVSKLLGCVTERGRLLVLELDDDDSDVVCAAVPALLEEEEGAVVVVDPKSSKADIAAASSRDVVSCGMVKE